MEAYIEQLIKRRTPGFMPALQMLCILLAVCSAGGVIVGYPRLLIGAVLFGLIAFHIHMGSNIEYEYLYVDKELTVDRIIAQSRRKKLAVYAIDSMELLAPEGSERLRPYDNRDYKVVDFSAGDKESQRFVMIYSSNGDNQKIILEGSEELFQCLYSVAPRKVFKD